MRLAIPLLLVLAAPAQAFVADNGQTVTPTGPDSFRVEYRGHSVVTEFWCAAGDYVTRSLRAGPATRIWRTSGRRTGTEGIAFALSADGARPAGVAILGGDGESLSAAHALMLCEEKRIFPDEWF